MRSITEMEQAVMSVAYKLGVVRAVAQNGSRVYQQRSDEFADLDIIYVVPEDQMQSLIANREWLDEFGPRLIMQTPMDLSPKPINYAKRFNFLMLFEDGNRIDLGLVPEKEMATWAKEDPIAKVLYDPANLLGGFALESDDHRYWRKKPSQGFFYRRTNEFWWIGPYVVKGILRQQFFYAADHYFEGILGEYLMQVEWQAAFEHDFKINLGKNVGELFKYIPEAEQADLQRFSDMSSLKVIAQNLVEIQERYQQRAIENAAQLGLEYDPSDGERVMRYTKAKLQRILEN